MRGDHLAHRSPGQRFLRAASATSDQNAGQEPVGLDILDDIAEDGAADGPDTTRLFSVLVTAREDGDIALRSADGTDVDLPRETVIAGINAAFMVAIEAKDRDNKDSNRLDEPADLLRSAARQIDSAAAGFNEVKDETDFDMDEFTDAVATVKRAWDEFEMRQGS